MKNNIMSLPILQNRIGIFLSQTQRLINRGHEKYRFAKKGGIQVPLKVSSHGKMRKDM